MKAYPKDFQFFSRDQTVFPRFKNKVLVLPIAGNDKVDSAPKARRFSTIIAMKLCRNSVRGSRGLTTSRIVLL